MKRIERRGWHILVVAFLTVFLVFGSGFFTPSVFFNPLLKTFGWGRAKLSFLTTVLNLSISFGSIPVGWLMDRVGCERVIATGAALVGCGFLMASQAHSYLALMAAYLVVGTGIVASTVVPCTVMVANWFKANRGMALAVTASGWSLGGTVMNLIASRLIAAIGWRSAYIVLAVPLFFVVVPLVLVVLRTRPAIAKEETVREKGISLPGLDVGEALSSYSFWIIFVGYLFYGISVVGSNLHTIPYLISIGHRPWNAALVWSLVLGISSIVKILLGILADRLTGRVVLAIDLVIFGLGEGFLLYANNPAALVAFVVIAGATIGAPAALFPMVVAESMGLKRYGTLSGFANWSVAIGGALGTLTGGWIFDLTGSYLPAYEIFILLLVLAGLGTFAVRPFQAAGWELSLEQA